MSSSIPLAYLPIRTAGQVQAQGSDSSFHQLESRRSVSRSTDVNAPLSDTEHENENENDVAQRPSSVTIVTHVELKEGGYGWVVTGCKAPYTPKGKR